MEVDWGYSPPYPENNLNSFIEVLVNKGENGVKTKKIGNPTLGYIFILPAVLIVLVVRLYPMLYGIFMSLTNYNLTRQNKVEFVGLQNFIDLISNDNEFYSVIAFSFIYTICVVGISYILGMLMALLVNKDIKFRGFFRTLLLIPWAIPPVVGATNFLWILNDEFGIVNIFLKNIGLIENSIQFFSDMSMVRMTVICYGAWKSFPFMLIVLLSGLQSIPAEIYDSAKIDGSGRIKSFIYITLPFLKQVTYVAVTLMVIWTFNSFEDIYLLTEGGPVNRTMVLPIYTYYTAFYRGNMGYAATIAVLMSIILVAISVLNKKATD